MLAQKRIFEGRDANSEYEIILDRKNFERAYTNDDKVQAGPDAGEVAEEAEGNPLEEHLHGEEDSEDHVHNLQDELQLLVVLQVDVFEAERQAENNRK